MIRRLPADFQRLVADHPYLAALGGVGLAALLRLLLDPVLGDSIRLLIFWPVLLLLGLLATPGAYVFGCAVALAVVLFLLHAPTGSLIPADRGPALAELALGSLVMVLIGVIVYSGRRPREKAPAAPNAEERRRATERAAAEGEARFRAIADSAPVLIWMSCPDETCIWFNQRWLAFTGRTMEQERGSGWAEGVHPEDRERCLQTYTEAFRARREFQMEYRLKRHDGVYRWLLDHGAPILTQDGSFLGYVGSCVDIDDYITARAQLHEYGKQMEYYALELARSNAAMAEVTYAAAHDLKEPLRGITHSAQTLARELPQHEDARNRLDVLAQLSKRMYRLLDGLMELGRAGRARMELADHPIGELALRAARRACLRCGIVMEDVKLKIADDLPQVRCDEQLVVQALTELLANAIGFNDHSQRRVEFGMLEPGDDGRQIFYVRDNGIGIDQRHRERVFRLFRRLHGREEYLAGNGIGAGLTVARRIVERHGGQIWLGAAEENQPGTTVYFTLAAPRLSINLPLPPVWPEVLAAATTGHDATGQPET